MHFWSLKSHNILLRYRKSRTTSIAFFTTEFSESSAENANISHLKHKQMTSEQKTVPVVAFSGSRIQLHMLFISRKNSFSSRTTNLTQPNWLCNILPGKLILGSHEQWLHEFVAKIFLYLFFSPLRPCMFSVYSSSILSQVFRSEKPFPWKRTRTVLSDWSW